MSAEFPGLRIGHVTRREEATGCTVFLFETPAVGGLDIRGGASGTRNVENLRSYHLVNESHALLFAGGSGFGLDAAGGVMAYLEERGIGFSVGPTRVPIVPAAIIFDLNIGDWRCRPDFAMGYAACQAATTEAPGEGNVGAGTGATVGKYFGMPCAMKGGFGWAETQAAEGVKIAAAAVVNAFGDVRDPESGRLLAGTRKASHSHELLDTARQLATSAIPLQFANNTTLGAIFTDAGFSREEMIKLAAMGQNGLVQVLSPANTPFDGDMVFAFSLGKKKIPLINLGVLAAQLLAIAVVRAVRQAQDLGGVPATRL